MPIGHQVSADSSGPRAALSSFAPPIHLSLSHSLSLGLWPGGKSARHPSDGDDLDQLGHIGQGRSDPVQSGSH